MITFASIQSSLTDEERLLIRRADEMRTRAESGSVAISHFLTPRETFILTSLGYRTDASREQVTSEDSICFFWGGYTDAERCVFCAIPPYTAYSLPDGESYVAPSELAALIADELADVIVPIKIKVSGYVNLSHRDYLGALLGLGLERSVFGDILVDETGAVVFAAKKVADFLLTELHEVGRDTVKVAILPQDGEFTCIRSFESISGTVASPRLDSVVSELSHASRETAKELIRRGLVEHNYFTATDCDAQVDSGDIISIKREGRIRNGKYAVDSIGELTAKGRCRFSARKYL